MRKQRGVTLIEVLVVMVIIVLLAGALVVLISGLIERQKFTRTASMIKSLSAGCESYHTLFQEYPPTTPYTGSQNLHYYLGREFDLIIDATDGTKKNHDPILTDIRLDWLAGNPSTTDPLASGPHYIKDMWGNQVVYTRPDPAKTFVIRSNGPDGAQGGDDDVDNLNVDSYVQ